MSRIISLTFPFCFSLTVTWNGEERWSQSQGWDFLHGACSPAASCSLNDVCCSDNALMWEIVAVCSMWQIIRHANQTEAAVESLIMVRVPHKGTSTPTHPLEPLQTPAAPSFSSSSSSSTPPPPPLPPPAAAALVAPDRQMDQRQNLKQWEEMRRRGELGEYWVVVGGCGGRGGAAAAVCWFGRGLTVYFGIQFKCAPEHPCCLTCVQNK